MNSLWIDLLTSEAGLLSVATLVVMVVVGVVAILSAMRRGTRKSESTAGRTM